MRIQIETVVTVPTTVQNPRETRGYEEAVLLDTSTIWNLHLDETLCRDLPVGSAGVEIFCPPNACEVDWWDPEPGADWETIERSEFANIEESNSNRAYRKQVRCEAERATYRCRGCKFECMPEEVLFESESARSRAEIASYLRSVAEKLEQGDSITLKAGTESVTMDPPARPTFEVKAEREGPAEGPGELSIEFELEWDEDSAAGKGDVGTLEIE